MCVTARRPAGRKTVSHISSCSREAHELATCIMCAPHIKLMCVTARRPAGPPAGKTVSLISNCSRRGNCARPVHYERCLHKTHVRHGPPARRRKTVSHISNCSRRGSVLAPYIMCDPYMKLMCVTARRPAGRKTNSHLSNCSRDGKCARSVHYVSSVHSIHVRHGPPACRPGLPCTPAGGHHEAKLLDMY